MKSFSRSSLATGPKTLVPIGVLSSLIKTQYEVIEEKEDTAILKVHLITGKTHQIRAHLAFNNLYIIGDGKYGKNEINAKYKENN